MKDIKHYIEDDNLSVAWGRALMITTQPGHDEIAPLIVSVTGFDQNGNPPEDQNIRDSLDSLLTELGRQSVHTVANTIFPSSLWNPAANRAAVFDRYKRILPRIQNASRKNNRGLYFERMIAGGPKGKENQLDFAITTYRSRKGVRRSVLQVGVFDPHQDHSGAAQLGFPCLQHVTFAPTPEGLCVNAFYATQYIVERAYGNYLGLCRLGRFVASELQLPLSRMTCFTGVAECEVPKKHLTQLVTTIQEADRKHKQRESEDESGSLPKTRLQD